MKKMMFLVLFTSSVFAQELKEYQQIIFCTPTKSELINSLIITRIQKMTDSYPYVSEHIKFRLVFSDYNEVKASSLADDQIRIRTQNSASIIEVTTSYYPVKVYFPDGIWHRSAHDFGFQGYLKQDRYLSGNSSIQLNCQSRLSQTP